MRLGASANGDACRVAAKQPRIEGGTQRQVLVVSVAPGRGHNANRYGNSAGAYESSGNLEITVEINIPIANNEKRVAGFFAREQSTGTIYLMHDGAVGGGRKGVNRGNFLAWSGEKLVPVYSSQGDVRPGVVVAPLKRHQIADHIERFVQKVKNFKDAVRSRERPGDLSVEKDRQSYDEYYREFSGRKAGQRARGFEYISRHRDIVDALCNWQRRQGDLRGRIVKNAYVDLGIAVGDELTEVYEVKTSADRQSLYTGIGQLFIHGGTKAGAI